MEFDIMTPITQSPEADLDREIETLIGNKVRGTMSEKERVRLTELQAMRFRLMRPNHVVRKAGFSFNRRLTA